MTQQPFSRPGAMDLSALKQKAEAARSGGAGAPAASGGGGAYVRSVDEQGFNALVAESQQYPVIVEFYSPRAQGGDQLTAALTAEADAAQGRFLLARVNCDTSPQIAQAVGVQAVPTVVALLMGQALPLFQGVQPAEQVKAVVDQVLQAAVSNGLVGRVSGGPEAGADAGQDAAEPAADPRFAAADEALERGDFDAAVAEFDRLLQADPNDAEARAGKAQAGLLARTASLDLAGAIAAADAAPSDVDAALPAADAEFASGSVDEAFARLIDLMRTTDPAGKERLRQRVLELFETLGNADPRVVKARRALATALF